MAVSRQAPPAVATVIQSRVPTEAELRAAQERQEKAAFDQAAQQIRDAVRSDPALADLARQLVIDITPQGLRIQILDEERRPMFPLGSATPNDRALQLLQKVTPVLIKLPQDISIAGHTDSAPFPGPGRTNWELSTERANATRRLLVEQGLPDTRIRSVTGNADRDPLVPGDPLAAANRRIAIVVLRVTRPAEATPGGDAAANATEGVAGPAPAGSTGNAVVNAAGSTGGSTAVNAGGSTAVNSARSVTGNGAGNAATPGAAANRER
jgi:flagellar motor protein MotB